MVIAVAVLIPSWLGIGDAAATNMDTSSGTIGTCDGASGSSGTGRPADNDLHTFNFQALTSNVLTAANSTVSYLDSTPELETSFVSLTSTTDAVLYDQDYTTWCGLVWDVPGAKGTIGLRECIAGNGAGECEKSELRYDHPDFVGESALVRTYFACHEIAHSLGLNHRSDPTGCINDDFDYATTLSTHDRAHMNGLV